MASSIPTARDSAGPDSLPHPFGSWVFAGSENRT